MLHNQTLYDRKLTVRMDRVDHKPEGPPKLPEGLRGLGMGLGAGGNPLQDVSREFSPFPRIIYLISDKIYIYIYIYIYIAFCLVIGGLIFILMDLSQESTIFLFALYFYLLL
jgi:hypothetical protein